jgi:asparagine synthase (glutamine-hydrolysing)
MERYIPKRVTEAIKQGFSAPDGSWYRGESIDYVRDVLYHPNAKIYDYLDKKTLRLLIDEHLNGKNNRRLLIWSLLNLEEWCSTFLKKGA